MEYLEPRLLLAGNVIVRLDQGVLRVSGDRASNDFVLRGTTDGMIIVEGRNQTLINGANQAFQARVSSITRGIEAHLGDGDDLVDVQNLNLTSRVYVRGGKGNDTIRLMTVQSRELEIATERGDDDVQLQDVTTTLDVYLNLDRGNDSIAAPNLSVGRNLSVDPGRGDDLAVCGQLTVAGATNVNMNRGDDQFIVMNTSEFRGVTKIYGGQGNDLVVVAPQERGTAATFRAPAKFKMHRGNDQVILGVGTSFQISLDVQGHSGRDQLSDMTARGNRFDKITSMEGRTTIDPTTPVDAALAELRSRGFDTAIFGMVPDQPQAPVVTVATSPLTFTENGTALVIDPTLTVSDADSTNLVGATVSIRTGFSSGQDVLAFTAAAGITGTYDIASGLLTLRGTASTANYQQVLRSVTYRNTSENPTLADRTIRFTVNDGALTAMGERIVRVLAVDDPGRIVLPPEFAGTGTVPQRTAGTPIEFTVTVEDADDSYTFQLDLEQSGLPTGAALPTIDPSTGLFRWAPNSVGIFEIRVLATSSNRTANQETFRIEILPAP